MSSLLDNTALYRRLAADGERILQDLKDCPSLLAVDGYELLLSVPNRLYGAELNREGDAI